VIQQRIEAAERNSDALGAAARLLTSGVGRSTGRADSWVNACSFETKPLLASVPHSLIAWVFLELRDQRPVGISLSKVYLGQLR